MDQGSSGIYNKKFQFLLVNFLVIGALLTASIWVIHFVRSRAIVTDSNGDPELSQVFVEYFVEPDAYVDGESILAMGNYIRDFPETQNVQVLTGMTTSEVAGYMYKQVSAGLGEDCTYCHTIQNFAADEWDDEVAMARKNTARAHLRMSQDLNQNWLTMLGDSETMTSLAVVGDAEIDNSIAQKQPSGIQITCATCHLGEGKPVVWDDDLQAIPDDFRLPLDDLSILKVNAREDISLDTVQYNQYTMYHMNESLGVGCTHCHNSRHFPSWEQPAKYYATHMLKMSQHIRDNYSDVMGGQEPSCTMCHYGNILPPGGAKSVDALPSVLTAAMSIDELAVNE